jgi:CelD/BcsL family acetyltransferase involved in cellulose biosynthesis
MRTPSVWHYWILAYDHAQARYSPGILLLLEMLHHAKLLGVGQFDLGKGHAPYKEGMHTDLIPLAEGFCELPSLTGVLHHARKRAEQWLRHSPLHPIARTLARRLERHLNHG